MTEPPAAAASHYWRLGGHQAVAATVDGFSRRLAAVRGRPTLWISWNDEKETHQ